MSQNGNSQTTGPDVISSPTADTRTFSHRGTEVGSTNVALTQNRTGEFSPVLTDSKSLGTPSRVIQLV
jgi:hypothetical protein